MIFRSSPRSTKPASWRLPNFVARCEIVHLLGPPCTGKSHLASALGLEAVKAGKSVSIITLADLIGALAKAERESSQHERIRFYFRPSLLNVDEIGYLPDIPGGGNLFFQLVNARYEKGSVRRRVIQHVGDDRRGFIAAICAASPIFPGRGARSFCGSAPVACVVTINIVASRFLQSGQRLLRRGDMLAAPEKVRQMLVRSRIAGICCATAPISCLVQWSGDIAWSARSASRWQSPIPRAPFRLASDRLRRATGKMCSNDSEPVGRGA